MHIRSFLISCAAIAASASAALAQQEAPAVPTLRASITVSSDVVRIGDVVENAGSASQIAIFRSPDLGTTGTLPVAQLVSALRTHQVIGLDTRDLQDVSVTRASRAFTAKDIETQISRALERRNGLGEAANISVTFDRDLRDLQLDSSNSGDMRVAVARFDARNGRFDITFEVPNEATVTPTKLRFTGIAVETVEATILTRSLERGEIVKASDVIIERRPKAEVGSDPALRERVIGMQARKALRASVPLKSADLGKPDRVSRDQAVTLIYEAPGLYLTGRGKALESGTEGDVVNVINLQSKRTVQGTVVGPGQVSVSIATPRIVAAVAATSDTEAASVAAAPVTKKVE